MLKDIKHFFIYTPRCVKYDRISKLMRKNTVITLFICIVVLTIFAIISYKTLFGWWTVKVIGFDNQTFNWDPGGAYLGSGIALFSQRYAANANWPGHPGITLMFLIQIISRGLHWLAILFGPTVSYEAYVAKNMFWIILIAKIAISLLYLISSYVVYIFTLELINKKEIALLAVISYLTTYPVLAYFNNISPEPLMIIFTLLSILFILKYKKHPFSYKDNNLQPFKYLGLSALLTACSLGTKIVFAIPLVVLIFLFVLLEKHSLNSKKIKFSLTRRLSDSGLFLFLLVIFLIPIYWKVDLNNFFHYWFFYSPGSPSYISAKNWGINILTNLWYLAGNFVITLIQNGFYVFLPKFNYYGVFVIAESVFLLLSVFGILMFWKNEPKKRLILVWLIIFNLLISYFLIYHTIWHYFMIQLAFLAIFFAYFVYSCVNKIKNLSSKGKIITSILTIILCHSFSIFLFINLRVSDMKEYKTWQPYYEALRKIGYNEKIGVINSPGFAKIFGNFLFYMPKSSNNQFTKELSNYFIDLDEKTAETFSETKSIRFLINNTPSGTILREVGQ
jgi:hypothetical protein